jgi:hypothetical protein
MATAAVWEHAGAATTSWHANKAVTDDGAYVFFTTADALVQEDVNGKFDAYAYDTVAHAPRLISSGTGTSDSYFLDADADGSDVFFATRDRLVGWDVDDAYDLYDARVGGGFPEPVPPFVCAGDTCQGEQKPAVAPAATATELLNGNGDLVQKLRPRKRAKRCRGDRVRKRVAGRVKCVKKKRHGAKRAHKVHRKGR